MFGLINEKMRGPTHCKFSFKIDNKWKICHMHPFEKSFGNWLPFWLCTQIRDSCDYALKIGNTAIHINAHSLSVMIILIQFVGWDLKF